MNEQVAKVSIVGAGMVNNSGVACKMFEALYGASVNINMISTSEIKVSVLVNERDADRAVRPSTTASSTNLEATPEQASKRCSPPHGPVPGREGVPCFQVFARFCRKNPFSLQYLCRSGKIITRLDILFPSSLFYPPAGRQTERDAG